MGFGTEPPERGLPALLGRVADAMGRLVTQHLTLARLELAEDARQLGQSLGRIALFVPFLVVGYAFLCGALAAVLSRWLGIWGALAVMGGVNLVGGGIGILHGVSQLRQKRVMPGTQNELNRSATVLSAASETSVSRQERTHDRQ